MLWNEPEVTQQMVTNLFNKVASEAVTNKDQRSIGDLSKEVVTQTPRLELEMRCWTYLLAFVSETNQQFV